MNARFLAPLLASGVVTSAATADFLGLIATQKQEFVPNGHDPLDLYICSVYARFDGDNDRLLGIGFAKIRTHDGSDFYQWHPAQGGGETAPESFLIGLFPGLVNDTFVTIGVQNTDEAPGGVDGTTLDEQYINLGNEIFGGWFNNDPDSGQGDAANYQYGSVLVAQLAVTDMQVPNGPWPEGFMRIFWQGDSTGGKVVSEIATFWHLLSGEFEPADLDKDFMVGPADLAILLGAWGRCPVGCWADLNLDGTVNAADLAILLGAWCAFPCG